MSSILARIVCSRRRVRSWKSAVTKSVGTFSQWRGYEIFAECFAWSVMLACHRREDLCGENHRTQPFAGLPYCLCWHLCNQQDSCDHWTKRQNQCSHLPTTGSSRRFEAMSVTALWCSLIPVSTRRSPHAKRCFPELSTVCFAEQQHTFLKIWWTFCLTRICTHNWQAEKRGVAILLICPPSSTF